MVKTYKVGDKIKLAHPRAGRFPIEGHIYRDYAKDGDGVIWVLQNSACVKSHYTEEDHKNRREFDALPAHRVFEVIEIEIDGGVAPYVIKRISDASDAAVLGEYLSPAEIAQRVGV